jgi:hypothetical protein
MPGVGIAGPDRASLGENSRMLVGGDAAGVNGTWVRFRTGTVAPTVAPQDATDNMSGGYTEDSRGPRSLMVSADCIWRAADNPISAPVRFEEGQETERIIIWPDFLNAPAAYFKMRKGFCRGYAVTMVGTGDITFSLDLKNQLTYYTPTRPDPLGVFAL